MERPPGLLDTILLLAEKTMMVDIMVSQFTKETPGAPTPHHLKDAQRTIPCISVAFSKTYAVLKLYALWDQVQMVSTT